MRALTCLAVLSLSGCASFGQTVGSVALAELNCLAPSAAGDLTNVLGDLGQPNANSLLNQEAATIGEQATVCLVQKALAALEGGAASGPVTGAVPAVFVSSGAVQPVNHNVSAIARGVSWLTLHTR